jgi:peptide/nickel transport system permease protein/peptide/nickel transport system substrate-binding protein
MRWRPARGRLGRPGRRIAVAAIAAIAATGVLAACGGTAGGGSTTSANGQAPQSGGVLRIAHVASRISSLDPVSSGSGFDQTVLYSIFDTLVNFDPKSMVPTPGLATSWSFVTPTELDLTLRQNVKFQDGTPFNAAAVVFNLNRDLTTKNSFIAGDLTSIQSVTASGDDMVKIALKSPNSALPLILSDRAGMMVSPTAVQKEGDATFMTKPVGAGPFMVTGAVLNQYVTMTAFAGYWGGKPRLAGLKYTVLPEAQAAVNALLNGQQDFIDSVPAANLAQLKASASVTTVTGDGLAMQTCEPRLNTGPLASPLVRQALNYALDRTAINKVANLGYGKPSDVMFPPESWAYPSAEASAYSYDPAKAKQLLAQAGVKTPVTLTAAVDTLEPWPTIGQAMVAQMAPAGFNLKLVPLAAAESTPAFTEQGKYDLLCKTWTGRPDPYQTYTQKIVPSTGDTPPYTPPAGLMSALQATIQVTAIPARQAAIAKLEELVTKQYALLLPIVTQPNIQAMSTSVHGFVPNLYGKPKYGTGVWLS